jgi:phosphoribosylamine---glycine ligase
MADFPCIGQTGTGQRKENQGEEARVKVLVLGGGGREHALCWALDRDPGVDEVLCAPGNAGIAAVARCLDADPSDTALIREIAVREQVGLVVVGPEAPLVAGVADALQPAEIPVFGPTRDGAMLESSKSFTKEVLAAAGVPTARYWSGTDPEQALAALDDFDAPYVIKADGLAAGKGVRICAERDEAEEAVREMLVDLIFGEAGSRLVIEEYLDGREVSLLVLCDGDTVVPLVPAQDYKRALDGDEGLNTGGMGAYSPVADFGPVEAQQACDALVKPVADELRSRGTRYVGVLYAGLMLTSQGTKVLEFNVRFGDPETQVVLPRLRSPLGQVLLACANGELAAQTLEWDDRACATVVLASGGYPGGYDTGKVITGLDAAEKADDVVVFHAGTRERDGEVVTAGGRVLAVSGVGATVEQARATAYAAADMISFDGLHRRNDIAAGR